jgi:tetratricopeptide (TPR) repeat protein
MLGMIYEAQKDLPAAEAQYQNTLAIDPEAAVAANNLAWLFVASKKNLDQAQQLARTALKQLPDNPQVNDTLGWAYYLAGKYELAVKALELSVARDKSDPTVFFHLGMTYVQIGEPAKARQALEKALAMNPNFEGAADAKSALNALKR